MRSLIRLQGDRSLVAAALLDATAIVLATLLAFRLNDTVWTRWIGLVPAAALGCLVLAGGYRLTLVYRSHVQTLSSALVSAALACIPVYLLLAGNDTERVLFLATTWVPLTCIGVFASRLLLRHFSAGVQAGTYAFVGVDLDMRRRLLEAFAQRPKFRPESIIDTDIAHFDPAAGHDRYPGEGALDSDCVIVYGQKAISSREASRWLLAMKIEGRDVYRDNVLYSELTGRLPVAGKELPPASLALERTSTGFHTRVVDLFRTVANIGGGFVLLALFFLPMLVIAVAVKWSDPGPIFFRQERLGKNKKPFNLYKFRTMRTDAEQGGPKWATQADDRVTSIGQTMRDLHLDELPQILNLCKGELNFVGPRPMRAHFAELLAEEISDFDVRFLVRPGLTGWAQTLGPYGRDVEEQREKFEYDLFYVANRHRLSDTMIVGMTINKFVSSLTKKIRPVKPEANAASLESQGQREEISRKPLVKKLEIDDREPGSRAGSRDKTLGEASRETAS